MKGTNIRRDGKREPVTLKRREHNFY